VYVCVHVGNVCVRAHVKGMKAPFSWSFLPNRGPACLSTLGALRGGLGDFPGLSLFMF
jgi:hypothetical protein